MGKRISRCVELLEQDQAIYYDGPHSGHLLTRAQGRTDAATWADYMNVGMEHGSFDMAGLAEYMQGMVEAGPTRSGHRTPTVIVEAPVNGIDAAHVRYNAWQFRQILGRGAHGILLCQAETADAVRAFVESCRYPHNTIGTDPSIPSPLARMEGAVRAKDGGLDAAGRKLLGIGTRGRGSETTAAPIWGLSVEEYMDRCDPWPLNPNGELLLGVKLESPEGVANCEEIIAVPGLAFAEIGPGDLSLSLGYRTMPRDPWPDEMLKARNRILAACRKNRVAFLQACTADNIVERINEGVRVVAGHSEAAASKGRAHQKRTLPV
jgi:4-hydroxy-2-oxoheptanedioate aldolase